MLRRTLAGFACFFVVLSSSCTSEVTQLPIATPQTTPEIATATSTVLAPPATATQTPPPTPVPADAISPDNLNQVRLLHQYWLVVATAAEVDPYEMDISAVASSPDGRLLAVGGCSKPLESDLRSGNVYCNGQDTDSTGGIPFLLILDANTESVIVTVPENATDTAITDLAFTQDGNNLIYALHPGKFALWNIESGQVETILSEADTSAPRIAVSPDGKWIALKTSTEVQILDAASGEFVAELPAYFRPQFSADSGRISVFSNGEFLVYETSTWTEVMRFGLPCECIYALSPDFSLFVTSERVLSGTESAPILIWDTSTGEQIQSLEGGLGFTAFLVFTPDGHMLWRAGERGDLMAWDTSDWQLIEENIGGITPIFNLRGFQFVEDGRHYLLFSDLHFGLYGLP